MTHNDSLADYWASSFTDSVRKMGRDDFLNDRIEILDSDESMLHALVGDPKSDYEVGIILVKDTSGTMSFKVSCGCSRFQSGKLCRHIWAALLLTAEAVENDRQLANYDPADRWLEHWMEDGDAAEDSGPDFVDSVREFMSTLLPSYGQRARRKKARPTWRDQLHLVTRRKSAPPATPLTARLEHYRTREAWYVIDVGKSVAARQAVIVLFQRDRKKNGQYGKPKSLRLSPTTHEVFDDPQDRSLLTLIRANEDPASDTAERRKQSTFGFGYRTLPITDVSLLPASYSTILPQLAATERLVWQVDASVPQFDEWNPVAWDSTIWQFRVNIVEDAETQELVVTGEFVHPETGTTMALSEPVLVEGCGLLLTPTELARHDGAAHRNWIAPLQKYNTIRVPMADATEFLEHLVQTQDAPDLALPESDRFVRHECDPKPILRVRPQEENPYYLINSASTKMVADVSFAYGSREVPASFGSAGQVEVDDDGKTEIFLRKNDREQEHLNTLLESPAVPSRASAELASPGDVEFTRRNLQPVLDHVLGNGWHVEADGQTIRQPSEWNFNVTSGVDWFELDGRFEFGGEVVGLPQLLSAVRNGEDFVTLDDGSRGVLPSEWLEKYASIADLAETSEDGVRFRPSQALLLDALLAAQKPDQVQVDKRFEEYRRKLNSFSGVSPQSPTGDFQGTLREYQRDGLGWLKFLEEFGLGGCLADDMGLGKTVQVLALLETRRTRKVGKGSRRCPSLAVVPKSLVFNWIEEAARFTPELRVLNYTGTDRSKRLEQSDGYDLLITTYGTLRRDIVKLKDIRFDYAILDESQAIKNAGSLNAKSCRLIDADHRLAMTGTPVENRLSELWSLFEFLNPGMLGRSNSFLSLTRKIGGKSASLGILARAIAPFLLRRTKEQVLTELPAKTEQTLYCDLTGKQRKEYQELRDYYRKSLTSRIEKDGIASSKIHVLEALLRLRQAACHPGLIDKKRAGRSSAKLDALLEQLTEVLDEGHKALVFSQFTSLLSIVKKKLTAKKIPYEYLDGKTTKRQQKVERFQNDPDCPVFLISLKAGGYGLNLTAADYVYILDPWWNPAVEAQAVDRTHRIGQQRPVFAYRLITRDTVEEKVLELQKQKRDLAEAIVSANDSIIRNLTSEDLELLLS